jgi:hypothetical protein
LPQCVLFNLSACHRKKLEQSDPEEAKYISLSKKNIPNNQKIPKTKDNDIPNQVMKIVDNSIETVYILFRHCWITSGTREISFTPF